MKKPTSRLSALRDAIDGHLHDSGMGIVLGPLCYTSRMSIPYFHPIIQEWFQGRFDGPTEAQSAGWPAIAEGRHTLISAPTGSGKTLAAFLTCIDQLVRQGIRGELPATTQVVYVSPLKALSNDIQKNLAEPLEQITALAEERGTPLPEIRTAVRTGDTKQSERARMAKQPPHILITTPESLYILLTSESGRRGLKDVHTVILDEIHAVADDKRGSHLSLSVERLCALSDGPVVRIGLSATQRPIQEVARFLVGNENIDSAGVPDCLIVNTGKARKIDLSIEIPPQELGPIATHEIWGQTIDAIAGLIKQHRTTLVFVNTRRLVERVSHQLTARLGEEAVAAHHGSLARETRLAAEERLKYGHVKVCVATASLELGIDIGDVDVVCQIGSPRSIGLLLQRVGRSGHRVGGTPKGRLYPLTRDELVECAALLRAVKHGVLDTLSIPSWPLDVLAQQMVASCSAEEWSEDGLFEMCRRAYPYRDLPKDKYDQVVEVLSQGFAPRQGRNGAFLHHDGVNHVLKGRRGARIAALTSGGAIPDNADYDVIADPEDTFVGTVNEDFAIESLAGDIFLLGNTPWKIRRVESGRVRVEDAQGQPPTIPFWLGEAPSRTWELSEEISQIKEELDQRLDSPPQAAAWLAAEAGISHETASQITAYILEGKRVLGMVPTARRVVAERFFDESGGMQLVIHAPFGAAINRAWGMALRKRICRTFDFELQASATDDGLNFSLGPSLSFPVADVFTYLSSRTVDEVLLQAVFQAPVFGTRWRWNATRFLALLRHTGGRRVPAPLQRMRSDDLLAAVFPAQVQCQDNAVTDTIDPPDHPLVFETVRDCLTEALDLEGHKKVLAAIESGEIEVYGRDTVQPSVFSHQILNAMPYAFLDDAPLEERRARNVSLRRALPEDSRDLGSLDPVVIEEESDNAWPRIRDADELHDALLSLMMIPEQVALSRGRDAHPEDIRTWFEELLRANRAFRLTNREGAPVWVAAERMALYLSAFPDTSYHDTVGTMGISGTPVTQEDAISSLLRGWVESWGPFTTHELAATLDLSPSDVEQAVVRMEVEGLVLRGSFRPGAALSEFCDRRVLARIHRGTIGRLRQRIEPVSQASFLRFLFEWQHVEPSSRVFGEGGLLDVIEMLQGFEAAAGAVESDLLSCRVTDYQPFLLDRLCVGGEVVWGRISQHNEHGNGYDGRPTRTSLSRVTPITLALRESLDWLLDPSEEGSDAVTGAAGEVLEVLSRRGACFISDIVAATRRLPSDVEDAVWLLAAAGRVTSDSLESLRTRINGNPQRPRRASTRRRARPYRRGAYSRWSRLEPVAPMSETIESKAFQFLKRYGVVFPELLAREPMAPRWRDLVRTFRRLEARGEIRGGRFVSGFVGEQFALPEAVETLRKVNRTEPTGNMIAVSACDPLNLVGILTPGERVPALLGNQVVFCDGVPIASWETGSLVNRCSADPATLAKASALLRRSPIEKEAGLIGDPVAIF